MTLIAFQLAINIITLVVLIRLFTLFKRRQQKAIWDLREEFLNATRQAVGLIEQIYNRLSSDMKQIEIRVADADPPQVAPNTFNNLDKRHHVLSLAERGMTVNEITKKLNIAEGEAELIIRLRNYESGRQRL